MKPTINNMTDLVIYYYKLHESGSWEEINQEWGLCTAPNEAELDFIQSKKEEWASLGLSVFDLFRDKEKIPQWMIENLSNSIKPLKSVWTLSHPRILVGKANADGALCFPTKEDANNPCVFIEDSRFHDTFDKRKINHVFYENGMLNIYYYKNGGETLECKLLLDWHDAYSICGMLCSILVAHEYYPHTEALEHLLQHFILRHDKGLIKLAISGKPKCQCNQLIKKHLWDLCDCTDDVVEAYNLQQYATRGE